MKQNILLWAEERSLLKEENAPKQMIKLTEEVGELASAILKSNKEGQIDAIGDIQVVLIILAEQLGIDYEGSLSSAYHQIKNRTGKTVDGTFIKD
jgi:NTP pyrophosphatase (non-canonical NTP hydrolase)